LERGGAEARRKKQNNLSVDEEHARVDDADEKQVFHSASRTRFMAGFAGVGLSSAQSVLHLFV